MGRTRSRKRPPVYLTEDERRALMAVIRTPRDRAIFRLAMDHVLRASEVGPIQLSDWSERTKRIYLRRLKGSISQDYVLSAEERRALNSWIRVRGKVPGPLFRGYGNTGTKRHALNKLMHRYGELAQFPEHKRHFHCLKHRCGTMLRDAGVEIASIQDHLEHADIGSTMVYAQATDGQRLAVAERLDRVQR